LLRYADLHATLAAIAKGAAKPGAAGSPLNLMRGEKKSSTS
jgi:hypothetical protein